MRTEIQKELDRVEEYILNQLFEDIENPVIDTKFQLFLAFKRKTFDEYINECIKETEKEYGWIKKLDDEKFNQLWENHNKIFSALMNNTDSNIKCKRI